MSTFPRLVRLLSGEPDSRRAPGMETVGGLSPAPRPVLSVVRLAKEGGRAGGRQQVP